MMFRRHLLAGILAGLAAQAFAGPQHVERAERPMPRTATFSADPVDRLKALVAKSRVSGQSAMVLVDMSTGKVLESLNGSRAMPPASVTKVATTLYAINKLGADYHFTTRVLATGPVQNGIVQGDLVLVGGGDPALDSDELVTLIEQVRARGITGITGQFTYYAAALPSLREIDTGQPSHAGYNPGLSGLNLNFNRVYFEWKPKNGRMDLSLQARAERHSPHVRGFSVSAANRAGPIYSYSEKGGADHWSVAAGALKKPGGVWLPVRAPARYAAEVFHTLAHHNGLRLPAPKTARSQPGGTELARFTRRELKLVCRGMLHFSTNLTAEVLGLTASSARSLPASAGKMSAWLRTTYGATSANFRDHSGLADENRVSAQDMAAIVARASQRGLLDGVLRRHFVAGNDPKKPVSDAVEVRAKTGTLNFVRGLSGVIHGRGGKKFAFAIFSADLAARKRIDGTVARPPGTKTFANRARGLEQAVLAAWIRRYAL